MSDSPALPTPRSFGRRLRQLLLLLLGPALIAGLSLYVYLHGGRYVTTDNAYVKSDMLSISANVSGMVTGLWLHEGDRIQRGQLLLTVDDQPYRIAVARAEANLATVRGEIESLRAEYLNKGLEIQKAETDLAYRQRELERARSLFEQNSLSAVQFDQARYAADSADRALAEKRQALQVVRARLIDPGVNADAHPRVKLALAELEKAQLDLAHTEVHAPADGIVAAVSTHLGENVISGAPLMSLIDPQHLWIEANFKETDLQNLRVGQPVDITVDAYGKRTWHGKVAVITPATGSEFSLLPAPNSTGNWVKVVQRVPVRIQIDDYAGDLLLASGMSSEIAVDTGHVRHLPWVAVN